MREDIKKRLEQVYDGLIPKGYQKTCAGLMPDDWLPIRRAKELFNSHTDKQHDGKLAVLAATQDKGIISRDELDKSIQYSNESISTYKKVNKGNFIISLRSFQGGIEYSTLEGLVSPAYTVLKSISPISDDYYRNYFKTNDFISRLNSTLYGIRDGKQIGYQDFSIMAIHYPALNEQEKISEILNHCDKVIELKKQLIEEEQNRKKWLMQYFSVTSSRSEKLGDYISLISGQDFPDNKFNESGKGIPYLTGASNIIAQTLLINRWTEHATKIAVNGDVLLVCKGAGVGKIAMMQSEKAHIARQFMAVRVKKTLNNQYCYYLLQHYLNDIKRASKGLIEGIDRKTVLQFRVQIPKLNRQNEIVTLLSSVDNKIRLLDQELNQWQQKRKSLMQLLLTGLVRVEV